MKQVGGVREEEGGRCTCARPCCCTWSDQLLQAQDSGSLAGRDLVWQAEAGAKVADGVHEVHEEAELWLAQQLVAVYVTQTPHLGSSHRSVQAQQRQYYQKETSRKLLTVVVQLEHTTALFCVTPADCLCSKLLIGEPREHLCSRSWD